MIHARSCVCLGLRRAAAALAVVLIARSVGAQQGDGVTPPQLLAPRRVVRDAELVEGYDLQFRQLSAGDLSHTRVAQIVQDAQGFLWFGTQRGLYRYDGHELRSFRHDAARANTLSGVYVYSLLRDRTNTLWVGSDGFVDRFDAPTEGFVPLVVKAPEAATRPINASCLHRDPSGMLWLCTRGGLYRVDPEGKRTTVVHHRSGDDTSLASDEVQFVGDGPGETLWVGTLVSLDQLDRTSLRVVAHLPLSDSPIGMTVHEDQSGMLWIIHGMDGELSAFDRTANVLTTWRPRIAAGEPAVSFSTLLEDREGTMWFGTRNHGVFRFDREPSRFVRYNHDPTRPQSLADRRVNVLYQDQEGLIWAGLHQAAPAYFLPRAPSFQSIRPAGRQSTMVSAIVSDHASRVWLGLDRGVQVLDRATQTVRDVRELRDIETSSVVVEKSGILWFGTAGRGVRRLDPRSGRVTTYRHAENNPASLPSDFVEQMKLDAQGAVWAVTWRGLARIDSAGERFEAIVPPNAPAELTLHTATFAPNGVVWMGSNLGVHRFDPITRRFEWFRHSNDDPTSLSNDRVNSIHVASDGSVWIGTQGGLDHWDEQARPLERFAQGDGLAGSTVSCMLEDDAHRLWMSTDRGISRLDSANGTLSTYGTADGLPGMNLTGWDSCVRSESGEMFFAGFAGATAFVPGDVVERDYVPPVALTRFRLLDSQLSVNGRLVSEIPVHDSMELRLGPSQGKFSVEFAALSFLSPETNRIRFRLRGVQEQWTEVRSDQRVATYLSVPTGSFTFEVQGATGNGRWSPTSALRILKRPPWWSSQPFYALAVVGAGAGLVLLYRLRVRQLTHAYNVRMEERWAERTRIARELHDTLLQGFQGLMFRLQAVRDLLPEHPAKAVPILDKTLLVGEQAIDEARNAVGDLRSAERSDRDFVSQLSALAAGAASLAEDGVPEWELHTTGDARQIPAAVLHELHPCAQEAISNAFQHARATHVSIALDFDADKLRVSVTDDGVGFDPSLRPSPHAARHFGIQGMQERIARLGGSILLDSRPGEGTRVQLTIPATVAYGETQTRRALRWLWPKPTARMNRRG